MGYYEDLKDLLTKHEGRRRKPYDDKNPNKPIPVEGKITIGIGHNLTDRGISESVIDKIYDEDIEEVRANLYYVFPNFDTFTDRRRMALYNLMFNLGLARFRGFKKMIFAIQWHNWDVAASELLDSKYATQVGQRAVELAKMLEEV